MSSPTVILGAFTSDETTLKQKGIMNSSQASLASSTPDTVKCRDYYDDLELGRLASPEEIKIAFRRMALNHHPDKTADKEEVKMKSCSISTSQFLRAREAWEVLRDESKRSVYDQKLKQHDPPDHVWQEVWWDDLLMSEDEEEEDGSPGMRYYWPCRCGDSFEIEKEDGMFFWEQNKDDSGRSETKCPEKGKGQNVSFVVGCASCSLHIRVLQARSTLIGTQNTEKDQQKQILREAVLNNDVILRIILEAVGERQWLFWGGVCKSWRDSCKKINGDFMCTTSPLAALDSLSRLHFAAEAGLDLLNTCIKEFESSWLGPPGSESCWGAAQAGRLNILQELYRLMPHHFEEYVPVAAAKAPTPDVLKWLYKCKIGDWDGERLKDMIKDAASCGRIENAIWLRETCLTQWHSSTCFYAAKYNHLKFLQWARNAGCPWGNMLNFCQLSGKNKAYVEIFSWTHRCDDFPCDCEI